MILSSLLVASLAPLCLCVSAAQLKPPNLSYLYTANLTLADTIPIGNGPLGKRIFMPIVGGTFTGPKLEGKIADAGGDWGLLDANNKFSPDAKYVFHTSDNATILVTAQGHAPYEHITFETGSKKYEWLNTAVAIGRLQPGSGFVVIEAWEAV